MHTGIVANPVQLAVLTKVLDDYCKAHAISDRSEREVIGRRVMVLFGAGARSEATLAEQLENAMTQH